MLQGAGWRPLVSGTADTLLGIAGDREQVFAVGRSGTILKLR